MSKLDHSDGTETNLDHFARAMGEPDHSELLERWHTATQGQVVGDAPFLGACADATDSYNPARTGGAKSPRKSGGGSTRRRGRRCSPFSGDAMTNTGRITENMTEVPGIDIFASAGGLTLGLKQAGVTTVCAVEIEKHRVRTFARHTPSADIINEDIQRADLARYKGKVELVYGGPPCQPFSSGGRQRAEGDTRNMIPAFIRAIETLQPSAFFMENVPGLATGDRRGYFVKVLTELRGLGFKVAAKVVSAADYGVPQKRRRLFVVGLRGREFLFPEPSHGPGRRFPHVTVRDALPASHVGEPNGSRVFYAKRPDTRPSPYDGHLFNGGGRAIDRSQPCHTILASAGGNKTHFFDDENLVIAYHAHLLAGGKPRTGELQGARRLTVVESAMIQTFPDGMVFDGPPSAQYHQVGDAVPPKLAAVMGRALIWQLRGLGASPREEFIEPAQQRLAL